MRDVMVAWANSGCVLIRNAVKSSRMALPWKETEKSTAQNDVYFFSRSMPGRAYSGQYEIARSGHPILR
jgi:hypothetical protein